MKVFSNYAQFYDLLNQGKDYKKEVDYISSIIEQYKPLAKNILDLGCGTGLHALQFADKGYKVVGIDQSKKMISIANQKLSSNPEFKESVQFMVSDLRTLNIDRSFDIVVALFHVMSYQVTNEDLSNSIKSVADHTKNDSLFIFDCWYGPAVLTDKPYKRTKSFEDSNLSIKRIATPTLHLSKNLVDVNFNISITDKRTKIENKINELHKMRYLFEPEMKAILSNYGFEVLRTEEWMTGNDPGNDTWYVTFICKKI